MFSSFRRYVIRLVDLFPAGLASLGFVDRRKGRRAFRLAVPVMMIGGVRIVMRLADYVMVSRAMNDAAVAGLTIGFQYYFIGFGLALALSSGTISVVSRFIGGGEFEKANLSIKISGLLALGISLPLTALMWFFAHPLVRLLTADPYVIHYGGVYLQVVMLSMTYRFWSMIGARALAGSGDTETPMWIRFVNVPTNIILNYLFIFGIGVFPELGVVGAALGTVLADALGLSLFFAVLLSGNFDVRLRLSGPQWDSGIAREIVRVGTPLAGMRLSMTLGRFPFIYIVGVVGTSVLASFGIGRRVMLLALMPAWGFATAASTMVGQFIGAGTFDEADDAAWQTLRVAIALQLLVALGITIFAEPIAAVFESDQPITTVAFIQVMGLGVFGYALSRTMQGALRGAGDTSWPFYGTLLGTLVRLGIASLALPGVARVFRKFGIPVPLTPGFGLVIILAAIIVDMYIRAGVNLIRFASGKWREFGAVEESGEPSDRKGMQTT